MVIFGTLSDEFENILMDGCMSNVLTLNKLSRSIAQTRDRSLLYCNQQYLRSFDASISRRELFYLSRITMCLVFSASVETRLSTYWKSVSNYSIVKSGTI